MIRIETLVESYLDAWNRRDVAGVLSLLHPGAAYYDALWRESCVGHDLAKYLQDGLSEDTYKYEIVGDLIATEDGVVYCYAAFEWNGEEVGEQKFSGIEVLVVADGKILTISNHYSDPDPIVMREVARLAVRRHGEKSYADGGNGAYKYLHVKNRLSAAMNSERKYLDPALTVSGLAEEIGCEVNQLLGLINSEFGTDFQQYVNQYRLKYAASTLLEHAGDPIRVSRVAADAGFRSAAEFRAEFTKSYGSSPEDFDIRTIQ